MESSVNELNAILSPQKRRKSKDILLQAICLSHEWTFLSFFDLFFLRFFSPFCCTSLTDKFHSEKTMSSVYLQSLKKNELCVCFRRRNKRQLKRKNEWESYEYFLMKMWHSSFVLCDCRHKFLSQLFEITASNLIFPVTEDDMLRGEGDTQKGTMQKMSRHKIQRIYHKMCEEIFRTFVKM